MVMTALWPPIIAIVKLENMDYANLFVINSIVIILPIPYFLILDRWQAPPHTLTSDSVADDGIDEPSRTFIAVLS